MVTINEIKRYTTPLENILQFTFASPLTQKELLSKEWFKKSLQGRTTRFPHNYKEYGLTSPYERMDTYKALLQTTSEAASETTIVQEEVYKTVWQGAQPKICFREAFKIIQSDRYRVRNITGESAQYAGEVSEGGASTVDTQEYSYVNSTPKKYGVRPLITHELITDSLVDCVGEELRFAGRQLENRLNRECLNEILNSSRAISTNTLNPEGAHISVTDIARMRGQILASNRDPNTIILHPTAQSYLLQDSNLVYVAYAGGSGGLREGQTGKLVGLDPYLCTATDLPTNPVWDDTTAGSDVTAIVYDKENIGCVNMKEDLRVLEFDDPVHDLFGMNILMRFAVTVIDENSGGIIYHK